MNATTILLILALALFIGEAVRSRSLMAAGLACWVATLLL